MKVISFNLLCSGKDEDAWTMRIPRIEKIIKNELPDILGVQEAHLMWMNALDEIIGKDYAHIGVGRDDGKLMGEFSAVFYLREKFDCLDSGTFWLSETPDVPSKGWGGACIRICSWSILKEKATGKTIAALNTHLDHVSEKARSEGIKLVVAKMKEMNMPVVCTGDFNTFEDSEAYAIMTASFGDTKYLATESDTGCTYQAFDPDNMAETSPIDFIFVNPDTKVNSYRIIRDRVDGRLPSDHFPIASEFELK